MTTKFYPVSKQNFTEEVRVDTYGSEASITVYNVDMNHIDLLIQTLESIKADYAAKPVIIIDEPPQMTAVLGQKPDPTGWYRNALQKVAAQPEPYKYVAPHTSYEPDPEMPQPHKGIHTINVIGVASKKRKNYGGIKNPDMNADIIKGESIRIYGISEKRHKWDAETKTNIYYKVAYDRTFKIGDTVEYGSYNFAYTGKITAIGEKTVKIDDGYEGRNRTKMTQLSIEEFIRRNWDLDLKKIAEDNYNWSMTS
jgi:hypothetical protein